MVFLTIVFYIVSVLNKKGSQPFYRWPYQTGSSTVVGRPKYFGSDLKGNRFWQFLPISRDLNSLVSQNSTDHKPQYASEINFDHSVAIHRCHQLYLRKLNSPTTKKTTRPSSSSSTTSMDTPDSGSRSCEGESCFSARGAIPNVTLEEGVEAKRKADAKK
jgi:hypothetical protein